MYSVSQFVMHEKPLEMGATAVYPHSDKLESRYRFESRFEDVVPLCHRVGDKLHLPRALCPAGDNDQRVLGEHVVFPKAPNPKPHQEELFNETAAFLKEGCSGIVSAYTGWGKTVLGFHAAFVVQRPTLVVTTKEDIFKQWLTGAEKFLGLPPERIGEIRQDKCEVEGRYFVVALIQSLSKKGRYPKWIRRHFGLVIFDECHRVPADQFSSVASMFYARLRLGLSATPERADGKELVIYAHIGPIRAKTQIQQMVPKILRYRTAWECPRVIRTNKITGKKTVVRLPHQPGRTAHIEKILMADPVRTHMICESVLTAFKKGRKVVVFSTQHEHLRSMHRAVNDMGVSGRDMGFYIGASTKAEKLARDKAKARPLLFTTFSMMGEGTDIPWLDCGVMAIPRADIEQPLGRIRREYPGKDESVWLDFMDYDSPVFRGYSVRRMSLYQRIGATVKDMT